jgi:hypothetical protein
MDYLNNWNEDPGTPDPPTKKYSPLSCCYDQSDAKIQEEPDAHLSNPARKDYTDMASALIALSTFAGGFTIATQFITACPGTRVQALLAIASQFFLGTPLCLMTVYLYLYGLKEDFKVSYRSRLHALIVVQFAVSGLMLSTAFILLGVAIFAAEVDGKIIGIMGIVLLGVFLFYAVLVGLWKGGIVKFLPTGPNPIIWPSVWQAGLPLLIQLVAFGLLLGYGSQAASRAPIQNGCPSVPPNGTSSVR